MKTGLEIWMERKLRRKHGDLSENMVGTDVERATRGIKMGTNAVMNETVGKRIVGPGV